MRWDSLYVMNVSIPRQTYHDCWSNLKQCFEPDIDQINGNHPRLFSDKLSACNWSLTSALVINLNRDVGVPEIKNISQMIFSWTLWVETKHFWQLDIYYKLTCLNLYMIYSPVICCYIPVGGCVSWQWCSIHWLIACPESGIVERIDVVLKTPLVSYNRLITEKLQKCFIEIYSM